MTNARLSSVLRRAAIAAEQFCRDRKNGALRPRREWKAGRPEAFAASLRYLTHVLPDVHDTDATVVWRTTDGTVTVPAGDDFTTDLTLAITGEDFGASVRLRDPVGLAAAILSAWLCLGDPDDIEEERA